jgi:CHAD domain-containing protein
VKKFVAHWEANAPARAEAARVLPELLQHYFEHGDRVMQPGTSDKRLHEFRLATKRARYTLELFQPLFGAAIQAHLDGLKQIQQVLGQFNDCQASLELLEADLEGVCERAWLEAIQLRGDAKRGEFAELWLSKFTDGVLRTGWIQAVGIDL